MNFCADVKQPEKHNGTPFGPEGDEEREVFMSISQTIDKQSNLFAFAFIFLLLFSAIAGSSSVSFSLIRFGYSRFLMLPACASLQQ